MNRFRLTTDEGVVVIQSTNLALNQERVYSQKWVAEFCGVTPASVSEWLNPGGKLHGESDATIYHNPVSSTGVASFTGGNIMRLIAEGKIIKAEE